MCRLAVYLGPDIVLSHFLTEPSHSIILQSSGAYETIVQLNGDGFGVGWYAPSMTPYPAIFREVTPAWSNENLRELARVIKTGCVLAHVRKASTGSAVVFTNCHPFSYKKFSFMHNGGIYNFVDVKKNIVDMLSAKAFHQLKGTTDSEYLFALFLDNYKSLKGKTQHKTKVEVMAQALCAVIVTIEEVTQSAKSEKVVNHLNLVICDGDNIVATRYTTGPLKEAHTLFYCTGSRYHLHESGSPRITRSGHPHADHENEKPLKHESMVIVASEPLTNNKEDFVEVPPNYMILADRDFLVVKSIENLKNLK